MSHQDSQTRTLASVAGFSLPQAASARSDHIAEKHRYFSVSSERQQQNAIKEQDGTDRHIGFYVLAFIDRTPASSVQQKRERLTHRERGVSGLLIATEN